MNLLKTKLIKIENTKLLAWLFDTFIHNIQFEGNLLTIIFPHNYSINESDRFLIQH